MSMIWSRRARKRSFCPLSRRSLGRIESPSAKPTERQNHDQTPRSNCKKSSRPLPLSCKCNDLPIRGNVSKISRVQVLHGRLLEERGGDLFLFVGSTEAKAGSLLISLTGVPSGRIDVIGEERQAEMTNG